MIITSILRPRVRVYVLGLGLELGLGLGLVLGLGLGLGLGLESGLRTSTMVTGLRYDAFILLILIQHYCLLPCDSLVVFRGRLHIGETLAFSGTNCLS